MQYLTFYFFYFLIIIIYFDTEKALFLVILGLL